MSTDHSPAYSLDREAHRRLAVDLFNDTWRLMGRTDRTAADDDLMVHTAHASAYHWMQVGTIVHRVRSEWQCSRMYTVLGRAEPALVHARRALELCEQTGTEMEDWDLPFCYEAMARSHAVAGDLEEARRWIERGRDAAASIADDDDRELVLKDLATVPI